MTRLLVMGGGLIGARHALLIKEHPSTTLVGLVDPDPSAAPDLEAPRWAALQDVETDDVDGVLIATPTPLHLAHCLSAAERGWPMLVEKPLADTLETAAELVQRVKVPALVGFHRRHHCKVKALRQKLQEGAVGQSLSASLIWAMRKPDSYFEGNWRSSGGSPVMINLVHDIDLLRHLFGEIVEISAFAGPVLRGSGRVETGSVILRFVSGPTASISFADTAPSPWGFEAGTGENPNIGTTGEDMLWITGTDGGIAFPSLTVWSGSDWSRPAEKQPATIMEDPPPLVAQLDHFIDVVEGRAEPMISLQDATETLRAALDIESRLGRALHCPDDILKDGV
ncbi:MAG: Gfo/Idh/MocA family oxidoreductase [Pseudomonadota bacterium]